MRDEAIIESLSDQLAEAQNAISRVRELHKPWGVDLEWCEICFADDGSWAGQWPCSTIKALDGVNESK